MSVIFSKADHGRADDPDDDQELMIGISRQSANQGHFRSDSDRRHGLGLRFPGNLRSRMTDCQRCLVSGVWSAVFGSAGF